MILSFHREISSPLLWKCVSLSSSYPSLRLLSPPPPDLPAHSAGDDVDHLHRHRRRREPALPAARLRTTQQVRRPSPSGGRRRSRRRSIGAEVGGDNAQVLGAVRPPLQHLLLLRQVRHRRRYQGARRPQGSTRSSSLPLQALRRQGRRGRARVLELPVCPHARKEGVPLYAFPYARQRFCRRGPGYQLGGDQGGDVQVLTALGRPLCFARGL